MSICHQMQYFARRTPCDMCTITMYVHCLSAGYFINETGKLFTGLPMLLPIGRFYSKGNPLQVYFRSCQVLAMQNVLLKVLITRHFKLKEIDLFYYLIDAGEFSNSPLVGFLERTCTFNFD